MIGNDHVFCLVVIAVFSSSSAISEFKGETDTNQPFTTLRIRSHDGHQTYVIKMKTTCTIRDVKQTIAKKKFVFNQGEKKQGQIFDHLESLHSTSIYSLWVRNYSSLTKIKH